MFVMDNLVSAAYTFLISCVCVYVSLPFVVKFLPGIVAQGTFLNFVCPPKAISRLHKPKEAWKLEGVYHHFVNSVSGRLGLWHMEPCATNEDSNSLDGNHKCCLASAKKVVIYCHGNSGHRCFGHRRWLYSLLRRSGFHVVTFDYRGYGDSDGYPSEQGVIDDTVIIYKWVVNQLNIETELLVWGHSLGTAISTQALYRIQTTECTRMPCGLVLEAPFTSASDIIAEYPLSKYLAKLYPGKWMETLLENALSATHISFTTSQTLPKLNSNVLILHAEDDRKVPYKLGKKLFDEVRKRKENLFHVKFASFKASHRFGHNGIWQHPELLNLVESLSRKFFPKQYVELEL